MQVYEVIFGYATQYEAGNDCYTCATLQEAESKFQELKTEIEQNFQGVANLETTHTADTFAIKCLDDESYARVVINRHWTDGAAADLRFALPPPKVTPTDINP